MDCGLGKTAITLSAINDLKYDDFDVRKVLIIGPKRVIECTWPEEIKKLQAEPRISSPSEGKNDAALEGKMIVSPEVTVEAAGPLGDAPRPPDQGIL